MGLVKSENEYFQFSPKGYSPSDVTGDHCFLMHFV